MPPERKRRGQGFGTSEERKATYRKMKKEQMFGKQKFACLCPAEMVGPREDFIRQALLSVPQSTIPSSYYSLFMVAVPPPGTSPLSKKF